MKAPSKSSKQTAASSQQPQVLPSGKALVKSVNSGDQISLAPVGKKSQGDFEPQCYLAYISVPRIGTPNRLEDAFAHEARETIREMIIGRKVDYVTEYMAGNKRAISIEIEGEGSLAEILVTKSLAKVNERRGNTQEDGLHDKLLKIQDDVSKKGKGVWNTEPDFVERNTRQVTYYGEADYKPASILEESRKEPRPLGSILEHVFSPTQIVVYMMRLKTQIKMNMVHLYLPRDAEPHIFEEGKAFIDKMLLHRTIGIKLQRVDEMNGNLVGRLHFPQGDIASELLKKGYAKLSTPKDSDFDADYYRELKQSQLIGQTKRAGVWKDMDESEMAQNKSSVSDFTGKVVEIHSGDSLTVEKDSDHSTIRVFLSSVKAPTISNRPQQSGPINSQAASSQQNDSDPYGWEAKESLRKLAIGKKVNVEMEYDRVVSTRQGGSMSMNFAAVTDVQKNRNLAVTQLEKGLIRTNIRQSGDNASKYLEDLLAAEKKAQVAKLCLHNTSKEPPVVIFADLTQHPKQAKEFEAMVSKRKDKIFRGVVEYCFNGMKFKVRLEQEGRVIGLNLLGVRTMAQDKNQPTLLEYANDALRLAKTSLFQREVTVELGFADKRGTFFGSLAMPNKTDFGVKLCEEGLAQTHLQGQSRPPANFSAMEEAESSAKQRGIGIWGSQLNLMTQTQGAQKDSRFEYLQRLSLEMTDMKDATSFHVRLIDGKSQHERIDDAMEEFDGESAEDIQRPIMKGTLCAALFTADNKWYRVRVVGKAKGEIEVKFIDYGNSEKVPEATLRKLPAHLLAYEPQAMSASLAYVRAPRLDQTLGPQAGKYIQKHGLNMIHDAVVVESESGKPLKVILMEQGEEDWASSLNAYIVAEGLAILEKYVKQSGRDSDIPEQISTWVEFEDEARSGQIGLWKHGNAAGVLDDDDY